jgi:hypothetical protein
MLIDENTRLGLSEEVRDEEQGSVQLKGKIHPVKLFSVHPANTE